MGSGEECSSEHWLALESPNDQLVSMLVEGWTSPPDDQLEPHRLLFKYFFCRAREFWNQTWVTRLESPVRAAIRSKSWPSGLESSWKLACNTLSCSSVNVVRTLFVFDSDLLVGVELDSSLQRDASCASPSMQCMRYGLSLVGSDSAIPSLVIPKCNLQRSLLSFVWLSIVNCSPVLNWRWHKSHAKHAKW